MYSEGNEYNILHMQVFDQRQSILPMPTQTPSDAHLPTSISSSSAVNSRGWEESLPLRRMMMRLATVGTSFSAIIVFLIFGRSSSATFTLSLLISSPSFDTAAERVLLLLLVLPLKRDRAAIDWDSSTSTPAETSYSSRVVVETGSIQRPHTALR
jgi:hypothetical protein